MSSTSETAAINGISSWADAALTTGSITLTPAQMLNASIRQSGQAAGINYTTPSAAAIVAALAAGDEADFILVNNNTTAGAVTIVAGAGVSLVGTTVCAIATTRYYKVVATNLTPGSEAVSIIGLGQMVAP